MPVTVIKGKDTGIFRFDRIRGGPDHESLLAVLDAILGQRNIESQLQRVEDEAKAVFVEYLPKFKWEGLWPFDLPKDAPPIARDARRVLMELETLRQAKAEGDQPSAEYILFELGRLSARIQVRRAEHFALDGKKRLAERRKGGKAPKALKAIESAILEYLSDKPNATAKVLWRRFSEDAASDPLSINGFQVYRDGDRLVQIDAETNLERSISFQTFRRYMTRARAKIRVS